MGVVRDTQDEGKSDYRDLTPKEQDFADVLIEHVFALGKAIISRMDESGFARPTQYVERLGAELMHDIDDDTVLQAVRNYPWGNAHEHRPSGSASPFAP